MSIIFGSFIFAGVLGFIYKSGYFNNQLAEGI